MSTKPTKIVRPAPPPSLLSPVIKLAPPPALVPIATATKQRLARGRSRSTPASICTATQSEAHAALLRFLHRAQHDGPRPCW